MIISRRTISVSGLSLLTTASLGSHAKADNGLIHDLIEGTEEFALAVEACTGGSGSPRSANSAINSRKAKVGVIPTRPRPGADFRHV